MHYVYEGTTNLVYDLIKSPEVCDHEWERVKAPKVWHCKKCPALKTVVIKGDHILLTYADGSKERYCEPRVTQ